MPVAAFAAAASLVYADGGLDQNRVVGVSVYHAKFI